MVEKPFRLQERPGGLFLFSFENNKDKNKVLRGSAWTFSPMRLNYPAADDDTTCPSYKGKAKV